MITKTTNRTRLSMSGLEYDFTFRIDETTDLLVYGIDTDGISTLITTGFSVSFDPDAEEGTVTFVSEPTAYAEILMLRSKPYTQTVDIPIRAGFDESVIEKSGLDNVVMQIQQLKEVTDFCIKQDPTSIAVDVILPLPEDGKVLAWSGEDGGMENITPNDGAYLSKATQTQAESGTDDTAYMTSLKVKQEVEKSGTVSIPSANISGLGTIPVKATGAEIITGTDDAKFTTPKALKDAIVALQTAIYDYSATSTIVGFSAFTTKLISAKKIGKTCIIDFELYGASNSVNLTFTVPWIKNALSVGTCILTTTYDNGAFKTTPGFAILAAQTVTVYSDYSANAWTATGDKHVRGQIIYEEA